MKNLIRLITTLCPLALAAYSSALAQPTPGGIFVTGHDPDYHAYAGGANPVGAQHILQRAVDYVTFAKPAPRLLLVTDLRNPGGSQSCESDSRLGLAAAGLVFDVADYGSGQPPALDLRTVAFTNYDALVIASDFGGWLWQDELDVLNARRDDIIAFVNNGGGIVALGESGMRAQFCEGTYPGTSQNRYAFLPFILTQTPLDRYETGNTLTEAGTALGLVTDDINGNFSHAIFTSTGGMTPIDLDPNNNIVSMAARGWQVTTNGVASADLSVSIVAAPATVPLGTDATFAITITNMGPDDATRILLTNQCIPSLQWHPVDSTQGTWQQTNGLVLWNVGALTNGGSARLTVLIQPASAGIVTNLAIASANEPDVDPANNTATATLTVVEGSVLSINMFPGLLIQGAVGRTYTVESRADLANAPWTALTNIVLTQNPYLWIDVTSPNVPRRFYRTVLLP